MAAYLRRCADCRHWQAPDDDAGFLPGYGLCRAIKEASYRDTDTEKLPTALAVIDMYDDPYVCARFATRADFGCALWEDASRPAIPPADHEGGTS